MLVTCFYDIYSDPNSSRFTAYFDLFLPLTHSGIPIVLFIDPSDLSRFVNLPFTVKIVTVPLVDFELYQLAMSYSGDLPNDRTPSKDTKEFFALMNTKIEFVKRASELSDVPKNTPYMWIDFGILKIVQNRERVIHKLKEIHLKPITKMKIPGCWSAGRGFSVETINWRFCGGFFVMPKSYISTFFEHSKNVLRDFCTMNQYKLTWETNVWSVIETCAENGNMDWYFADHNDAMILNIDHVLSK